jgi:subtilisin
VTLPQWSEAFTDLRDVVPLPLPEPIRDWAWGGATGAGVKVAVIDSGIDASHPSVGDVQGYVAVERDEESESGVRYVEGPHEDLVGHGTACAAIIRSLAPDVELYSIRVLGSNLKGQGSMFLAGIEWAVDHGMHVANLSLSSKSPTWFGPLHDAADRAYFRNTMLVCAANNYPGPTYPSQFASVVSVAARDGDDPWGLAYNPDPPVEFAARGIDVEVAWTGGESIVATGNSFAAPHVAGMSALIRSKHPELSPFQVKSVLHALAENARNG